MLMWHMLMSSHSNLPIIIVVAQVVVNQKVVVLTLGLGLPLLGSYTKPLTILATVATND